MTRFSLQCADKSTRLAARAHLLPKDARPVLEHSNGSALYTYEVAGKLCAIAFVGTAGRAAWHHSYRTEEGRNRDVWNFREHVERMAGYRKEKAAATSLRVGDIVNTSWGYDQTNVDFFVVTRTTSRCVWVRSIAQDSEATGHMAGRCWPAMPIEMIGPETRHWSTGDHLSIDGHGAHKTTGDTYYSSYA
jgi:hypothetical protein